MRLRTFARWGTAALLGSTVAIGALHLPAFAPLLRGLSGGCPVGMDRRVTPEALDAARAKVLDADRGDRVAGARPALGFELGVTDRGDVWAWARARGATCAEARAGALRCTDVGRLPLDATHTVDAAVDDVLLQFDASDRLVAADAAIRGLDPAAAARLVDAATDALSADLGPPDERQGSQATLARGALGQLSSRFRFTDYRADLRATQVGGARILVRATYQAG